MYHIRGSWILSSVFICTALSLPLTWAQAPTTTKVNQIKVPKSLNVRSEAAQSSLPSCCPQEGQESVKAGQVCSKSICNDHKICPTGHDLLLKKFRNRFWNTDRLADFPFQSWCYVTKTHNRLQCFPKCWTAPLNKLNQTFALHEVFGQTQSSDRQTGAEEGHKE